ncbi:hypothetical protein GGD81_001095 [Rhodobium orientis]|uniref:Lipoprotein n=1 Tax=Rhodobium orientis TaxID=34017 RepID=A0A327JIW8_9HYPH|nr:hypothetical protein [Rhodobium orientis]MBB4302071.1 hypothetical protein [Rhodobium orientis]MBK5951338.1 hypothetical protein [Rhodobium orientis]RAI25951.1 hypothetical protein CH339_16055 [Rhodobium orientis]
MLRIFVLIAFAAVLAGCNSRTLFSRQDGFSNQTYLLASSTRRGRCYTRIVEGLALDQICQRGDYIRYSPKVRNRRLNRPIPPHVIALFETMSETQPISRVSEVRK